jgi:uncharacterized membrane protein YdbT with pleckstrin-like domain
VINSYKTQKGREIKVLIYNPKTMSYISQNLKSGERIIFETRLHWLVMVPTILWGWLLLFIPIIIVFLEYRATEFSVTNQRIVIKYGVLSRNVDEAPLDKIQNISLRQSFFGRLLNFGTIVVQTAATFGRNTFPYVKNPLKLRQHVSEQIDLYKEGQIKKQAEALAREMKEGNR